LVEYILIVLIIICLVVIYLINNQLNSFIKKRHNNMVEYFNDISSKIAKGKIVFLGDSITAGFLVNDVYEKHNVVNRGIGGDTTADVLNRLKESVINIKPSKIFLLIGANDLRKGKSTIYVVNNIKKIIEEIENNLPNTKLYVQSIYPIRKTSDKKIMKLIVGRITNEKINDANMKLKQLSKEKNFTYIDVNSSLIDALGQLKLQYTVEGLHISAKGYSVIENIIISYIS